jgi:hypothetical protein
MQPDGDELVIVADLFALAVRPAWALTQQPVGLVDVARHRLSAPGQPRIDLGHYPDHPDQHPRHGHHPVTGHTHTTRAGQPTPQAHHPSSSPTGPLPAPLVPVVPVLSVMTVPVTSSPPRPVPVVPVVPVPSLLTWLSSSSLTGRCARDSLHQRRTRHPRPRPSSQTRSPAISLASMSEPATTAVRAWRHPAPPRHR